MKTQNTLDLIFKYQKELQESLGIYDKIENDSDKQQYINQNILALHEEAVEIMRETAYKNPEFVKFGWKKGQTFNEEKFKEEIIDLMHFLVNLAIISGMDSYEFFDRYVNKNKENHKRQEDGY